MPQSEVGLAKVAGIARVARTTKQRKVTAIFMNFARKLGSF